MKLRKLRRDDAPLMLAWMHDTSVVAHLGTNFGEKTIDDCINFIAWADSAENDLHLAVADGDDTYMGTVSLKHIDRALGYAEFAITVRKEAMGKGYAQFGMAQILRKGLELGLTAIYWCVSPQNERAVRFYDKCGYSRTQQVPETILAAYDPAMPLYWYVFSGENL